jgi:hypothetical protein
MGILLDIYSENIYKLSRHTIWVLLEHSLFFLWDWDLNSGLVTYKAEPHLQSILLWLFWRWPQTMIFPILASQVARIIGVRHWHPAF